MESSFRRVSVAGTGSFLPNDPVPNDRLEEVLGPLTEAPAKVQSFIRNLGPRMLESGGVDQRHFAVDPKTHRLTHTTATLAEEAARKAIEYAGRQPSDVEFLLLSSPIYDQMTPPTTTLVQERLGIENCAEMEIHSNCSGTGKCAQIAYDALRTGRYRNALLIYPQLSSFYLRNCYFNQTCMTKTQAALRYILADGSGAVFMEACRNGPPEHEVLGTFVESVGGKRAPGMTAGGAVVDLIDWDSQIPGMYEKGLHHLSQDFSVVNRDAGDILLEGVQRMLKSLDIDPGTVDHYLFSIPTVRFHEDHLDRFTSGLKSRPERMKFRARNTGYCGGASMLLHLDEMVRSGELKRGQTVALHSVESSKWMTGGFVVRW